MNLKPCGRTVVGFAEGSSCTGTAPPAKSQPSPIFICSFPRMTLECTLEFAIHVLRWAYYVSICDMKRRKGILEFAFWLDSVDDSTPGGRKSFWCVKMILCAQSVTRRPPYVPVCGVHLDHSSNSSHAYLLPDGAIGSNRTFARLFDSRQSAGRRDSSRYSSSATGT